MTNAMGKLGLLTAFLCLVLTVEAQVTNPNLSTFEVHLNTTTGASGAVDHLILRTEVESTITPGGGFEPESTTIANDHEWYISGEQGLSFSYNDAANSSTSRQPLLQIYRSQMVGHVDQFRIANDNILVNSNGVAFNGDNMQLGSSFTVDGLGAAVNGDLFSVGSSLSADANGLTVTGNNLQVGTGFDLNATELLLTGKDITLNNGVANEFQVTQNGVLTVREVNVNLDPIPDYVFEPDYELMSVKELEIYIKEHGHLPNIKSAAEYEEIGYIDLGELNLKLLEKMEEMSLYTIELEHKTDALQDDVSTLKSELQRLNKEMEALKAQK